VQIIGRNRVATDRTPLTLVGYLLYMGGNGKLWELNYWTATVNGMISQLELMICLRVKPNNSLMFCGYKPPSEDRYHGSCILNLLGRDTSQTVAGKVYIVHLKMD
jgi:hypothetical protein